MLRTGLKRVARAQKKRASRESGRRARLASPEFPSWLLSPSNSSSGGDDDDDEAGDHVDKLARMSPPGEKEEERRVGTERRGTVLLQTGLVTEWNTFSSSSSASSRDSSDGLDFLLHSPRAGGDDNEPAFTFDVTRRNTHVFADDLPADL
jgi:hypothetical protein